MFEVGNIIKHILNERGDLYNVVTGINGRYLNVYFTATDYSENSFELITDIFNKENL